ncbi:MAG: TIGR02444 family protein [Proteobacteria bacterium]|nr:TIGR02444 family protein [Pseudomonadota bacterium]
MNDDTTDRAWHTICTLYAEPALAKELLHRQDHEGLDVVLHLFGRWAEAEGRPLDPEALARADAHVASWREQVVRPLRRLRRAMKPMESDDAPGIAAVRRQVQAAELAAERAELEMLCAWLRTQ